MDPTSKRTFFLPTRILKEYLWPSFFESPSVHPLRNLIVTSKKLQNFSELGRTPKILLHHIPLSSTPGHYSETLWSALMELHFSITLQSNCLRVDSTFFHSCTLVFIQVSRESESDCSSSSLKACDLR